MRVSPAVWLWALCAVIGEAAATPAARGGDAPFEFGFSKVDVTPTQSVRLSGYANRDRGFEGIDEPLSVRVMALRQGDGPVRVLAAVDTIGFPGVLTREIHEALEAQHRIARADFVLACTHSHTAPHIGRGLTNLYTKPLSDAEQAAIEAYTDFVRDRVIDAVGQALQDLSPGRLFTAEGAAHFAVNRRVIENGKWTGFGVNPAGPVDHALPVLKITDATGETIRGLVFNYACHCTTFGGDYNRVNGDWAGYAATSLEAAHAGAVALCTIGCGADANPERVPERALAIALAQGREIADEVARLLGGPMREITAPLQATYEYAGLPIDRPSVAQLRDKLDDSSPQVRRHAELMLDIHRRMGRLPETYPMPVQVWRFGNQYAMVFLGGEVVAEYSLRIKRELAEKLAAATAGEAAPGPNVWVTAYANDVFGYVASERMLDEGGYEVDFSMIFYNQPGRWSSGTEEVVLRRVHEMFDNTLPRSPLAPDEALQSFSLPDGLEIGLVAAEPLIRDPINFAVAPDGRLWVVEMGDYPRGAHDDGAPGGRIQILTDNNADGRYDEAVTFLDEIAYPTGVFPWRRGAIVSAAPDIFYAEDTDGDGRADRRTPLYRGFKESNPQHRINGFAYGLDNWLYLASGAPSGDITCLLTGERVNVSGRDCRIFPDKGWLQTESGPTQYGRTRDDWGNWFGNENSLPLYHYPISDRYLRRNPYVALPQPLVHLFDPPVPPPVYPTSRTLDRFNDLYAENCFTSACSPHIFRDHSLGDDVYGAALVCEPVHNLVSRIMLTPEGSTFRGARHPREEHAEFVSSRDNWFRPTRLLTGPEGALWIADMYRMVIEHPQWIPEAWQERLNLYAGNDRGRIYRVFRKADAGGPAAFAVPDLTRLTDAELVAELHSTNGWRRDSAQLLLVQRESLSRDAQRALERAATQPSDPLARIHALNTLQGRGALRADQLGAALATSDPHVLREAVRLSEEFLGDERILGALLPLVDHPDPHVRLQVALSLGQADDARSAEALARLATGAGSDTWLRAAVLSSAHGKADAMLPAVLRAAKATPERAELVAMLVATSLGDDAAAGTAQVLRTIAPTDADRVEVWQVQALSACLQALEGRNILLAQDAFLDRDGVREAVLAAAPVFAAAREIAADESAPLEHRATAAMVLARGLERGEDDRRLLASWLAPQTHPDLQAAAVQSLARLRGDDVAALLLSDWRSAGPSLRSRILESLLAREAWTSVLLEAIEQGEVLPADLDAAARTRLNEHPSEAVRSRAEQLLGAATSADRQRVVEEYASVFELTGDPVRGAALFEKRCATCHRHRGIGNDVGAKLAALQNKSTDFLLTAILDPNRAAEAKYTAYSVATVDGRVLSGMIIEETATSLTLAKADGTRDAILRVDLDSLAATGKSFMPEGLEKDLNPQELADVISFVQTSE